MLRGGHLHSPMGAIHMHAHRSPANLVFHDNICVRSAGSTSAFLLLSIGDVKYLINYTKFSERSVTLSNLHL